MTLKCGHCCRFTDGTTEAKMAKSLPEVTVEHGSLPGARDHNIFFFTLMLFFGFYWNSSFRNNPNPFASSIDSWNKHLLYTCFELEAVLGQRIQRQAEWGDQCLPKVVGKYAIMVQSRECCDKRMNSTPQKFTMDCTLPGVLRRQIQRENL